MRRILFFLYKWSRPVKRVSLWIALIAALALVAYKHYFWALVLLLLYVFNCFDRHVMGMNKDMEWIARAAVDETYRKDIAARKKVYDLAREGLRTGRVRKGMSLEEIKSLISGHSAAPENSRSFFEPDETSTEKRFTVTFNGYGAAVPAPELVLEFTDGRLSSWRDDLRWVSP